MTRNVFATGAVAFAMLCMQGCNSETSGTQNAATNGSAVVVGDEAPSAPSQAPVPVSGSGQVPPNANGNEASGSPAGNDQTGE
ncbi:MAG: hypothetical protein QHC67_10450 [Sphingobium sp.]|uniref:hypothetical protein n=1 Tax=Sphingobium sp. TaxID=1912891 RepID=UPI0029B56EC5|nr:hypothetical protein [Sphingobium sp.]MDX3910225.1 hypothetical protein [Sphingobium sp.]